MQKSILGFKIRKDYGKMGGLNNHPYFLILVHIKLSLNLNPTIVTTLSYSKPKKVEAILSYFKKNIILAQKLAKYRLKKNEIDSMKIYKIKFA